MSDEQLPAASEVVPKTETALTALRFTAQRMIPREAMEEYTARGDYNAELEALVLAVERKVWSKKIDEQIISYPATWWDACKERWFPEWARRAWPVLYRRHSWEAYHMYPGLLIKGQAPTLHVVTYELPQEETQ